MKQTNIDIETSNDKELAEAIKGLHQVTLAEDTLWCLICNESISTGQEVVCYLLSPTGTSGFDIGQCRCIQHADHVTELFTLNADEVIVKAHIGRSHDETSEKSWPVLLTPRLRMVSDASTTTGREVNVDPYNDENLPAALTNTVEEQTNNIQAIEDPQPVDDDSNWQSTTLSRWEQTTEEDF